MTQPYLLFGVAATARGSTCFDDGVLLRLKQELFEVKNYGSAIIMAEP
jgi:hypothetical protein